MHVDARVLSRLQREVAASDEHLLALKRKERQQAHIMHEAEEQARAARQDENLPLSAVNGVDGGGLDWYNSPAKPWWLHKLNPFLSARKVPGDPIDETRASTPYLAPVVPGENGIPAPIVRLVPGDRAAAREEQEAGMESRYMDRPAQGGEGAVAAMPRRERGGVDAETDRRKAAEIGTGGGQQGAGYESAARTYVSAAKSLLSWLQGAVSLHARPEVRQDDEEPSDESRGLSERSSPGARRSGMQHHGAPRRDESPARGAAHQSRRERRADGGDRLGTALVAALTGGSSQERSGGRSAGGSSSSDGKDGENQVWKDMRRLLVDTLRVKNDKQRAAKDKTMLARDSKMRRQESLGRLTFGHSVYRPQDI